LRKESIIGGGAVVVLTDISARKEAEERQRKERERLEYILDTSPIACAFAADGKVIFANKPAFELTGISRGDFTPDLYVNEADRDVLLQGLAEKGKVENYELKMNGAKGPFDALVTYYSTEIDDTRGILAWLLDISERKRYEEKLKDAFDVISSSIDYASRIQRSVLPDDNFLSAIVSDHFILWEPRDIVGGDVHWEGAWGNGCLIILGDCTGHGVPGAFMTLIFIGALERAMAEVEGGNVGALVSRIHQLMQVTLGQHFEGGSSDDGIELGACYFVPEEPTMTFVGARFDLFLASDEEVSIVKGTKKGMGYRGIAYTQTYEEQTVPVSFDQTYYLTSDGLIDQVGGEKRRMFGKNRFKELLLSMRDVPMEEQKLKLMEAVISYQGAEVRRDDIAVVGFKF